MGYGSGAWGGRRDRVAPVFAGITALDTPTVNSLVAHWDAATDDVTPVALIVYDVSVHTTAAQPFVKTLTSAPGATSVVIPELDAGTVYYVVVRARDEAGNRDTNTVELSASTLSDTTAPSFAGLQTADAISDSAVLLGWNAATDDVSPQSAIVYNVYVATTPGGENFASPTMTSQPGATLMIAGDLANNTLYYFVVRAQDEAGNEDTNTVEKNATTGFDTTPPVVVYDPPDMTQIEKFDPITITVTDNIGSFRRILVTVRFEGSTGIDEVVHDGVTFRGYYPLSSTRALVANGFEYQVLRHGGWPGTPKFEVFAIDSRGNEAN